MKKGVLFSGIGILILGAILIYVSGLLTGPGSSTQIYPILSSLQLYWTILAIVGVVIIILGAFLKKK